MNNSDLPDYTDKALHCPNPQCTSGPWDNWKSLLLHINNQFSRCKEFRYTPPPTSSLNENFTVPHNDGFSFQSHPKVANLDPPLRYTDNHPTAAHIYGHCKNTLEAMDADQYAHRRVHNAFYPFKDEPEWELARFLCQSSLKQGEINEFLKLPWVRL